MFISVERKLLKMTRGDYRFKSSGRPVIIWDAKLASATCAELAKQYELRDDIEIVRRYTLELELRVSKRNQNGDPRHTYVYLGRIREDDIKEPKALARLIERSTTNLDNKNLFTKEEVEFAINEVKRKLAEHVGVKMLDSAILPPTESSPSHSG